MKFPETIFEKTIGHERPTKVTFLIGFALLLIALVVGSVEYSFSELFSEGFWRGFFIYPSIIFYILLIAPKLTQMENKVIGAIIPLGDLSENKIHQIFEETQAFRPLREWLAVGVGVLIITISLLSGGSIGLNLTGVYFLVMAAIAFGILSWTVYASVVSVRITAQLLKQPLQVNLFDLDAFKVVGKSSLYLSLAFIGGFTLALFFSAPDFSVFQSVDFWIINFPMFVLPVIIFFSNMYPTHKIIDSAKRAALKQAGQKIRAVSDQMLKSADQSSDVESLSHKLQGLIALEERLSKVQTWPYEVSTLRSLLGSILIPAFTVIAQVLLRRVLSW